MSGDFREIFNVAQLDDRTLGEIEWVLNSPAYEHTFKPFMVGVLKTLSKLQRDRSQKRKEEYPDDYLAGGLDFGEGLIEFFGRVIAETRMDRMNEAMQHVSNDQLYDAKRARGQVKPVVGLDQSATPEEYNPAEDY